MCSAHAALTGQWRCLQSLSPSELLSICMKNYHCSLCFSSGSSCRLLSQRSPIRSRCLTSCMCFLIFIPTSHKAVSDFYMQSPPHRNENTSQAKSKTFKERKSSQEWKEAPDLRFLVSASEPEAGCSGGRVTLALGMMVCSAGIGERQTHHLSGHLVPVPRCPCNKKNWIWEDWGQQT